MSGWKDRLGAFDDAKPDHVVYQRAQEGPRHEPPDIGPRARTRVGMLAVAATLAAGLMFLTSGGSGDEPLTVVVVSASMLPTLEAGEHVAVDVNAYGSIPPARGDVIAFVMARDPDAVFIKRVIGVPGDTVEEASGVVYVNGQALDEPYAMLDDFTGGPWLVSPGRVFVMGDNRPDSNDSRYSMGMGQIPVEDILGKVLIGEVPEDRPQAPPPAPITSGDR